MGVLGTFRDSCILVNRTNRVLQARYDGEDIYLQPGENPGFPREAVSYAKQQNILMGSRHPLNPMRFISLVGVKGVDEVTPLSDETLKDADEKVEAVDRAGDYHDEPMRKVKLLRKRKVYDSFDAQVGMPDTGFAKTEV